MEFKAAFSDAYPVPQVVDNSTGYTYPILWGKVANFTIAPNASEVLVAFNCYASVECAGEPVTTVSMQVPVNVEQAEPLMQDAWTNVVATLQVAIQRAAEQELAKREDGDEDAPDVIESAQDETEATE